MLLVSPIFVVWIGIVRELMNFSPALAPPFRPKPIIDEHPFGVYF